MASLVTPENGSTLASRAVKDIYPVSRLVREVRVLLEGSFPLLWVEGEISNLAMPASGHIYFSLKDEAAQVRCAMFRNRNRQLRFTPENGMQVLLRVRVTMYEGRGEFQLVVEHMEEAGSGALQRAYEALKARLGQEGLFDQAVKKAIPVMPKTIGIVSSPDGAAVHDILSVLQRRFPAVNVILYPVAVQGEGAAAQIIDAINIAQSRQECDVLIIGRGGGSLEDLWSFNDERLARAIYSCDIPVISAVGHEIDFTIADFVADVRAPTPSAAAELAVPDAKQLLSNIRSLSQRLSLSLRQRLSTEQRHLQHLQRRLPKPGYKITEQLRWLNRVSQQLDNSWLRLFRSRQQQLDFLTGQLKHPQARIDLQHQKLHRLKSSLQRAYAQKLQNAGFELHSLRQRLAAKLPLTTIKQQLVRMQQLQKQLDKNISLGLQRHENRLVQQIRTLTAVSPLNTLERGYSITTDTPRGKVIHRAGDVEIGQTLSVRLQQGQLDCEVKKIHED